MQHTPLEQELMLALNRGLYEAGVISKALCERAREIILRENGASMRRGGDR